MCSEQCPEGAEEDQHHVPDHLVYLVEPRAVLLLRQLLVLLRLPGSETLQPGAAAACQPSQGAFPLIQKANCPKPKADKLICYSFQKNGL